LYICYLDESGVPEFSGGTSHFVLLGLAIPIETWQAKDREVVSVIQLFDLGEAEIHTGWMFRRYLEQERIAGFEPMTRDQRRVAYDRQRDDTLVRIAATKPAEALVEAKKTYRKVAPYVHLTRSERLDVLRRLAQLIGSWTDCRLFCEAARKEAYRGRTLPPIGEESFTQVVSRFQFFLNNRGRVEGNPVYGMLVQDNNTTVAMRLTRLMRVFHARGTTYTLIPNVVETPLFVDSALTGMVQMADLCAFATRRFFENAETDLFERIYSRFDRASGRVVGIRHFTGALPCRCRVCVDHGRV